MCWNASSNLKPGTPGASLPKGEDLHVSSSSFEDHTDKTDTKQSRRGGKDKVRPIFDKSTDGILLPKAWKALGVGGSHVLNISRAEGDDGETLFEKKKMKTKRGKEEGKTDGGKKSAITDHGRSQ